MVKYNRRELKAQWKHSRAAVAEHGCIFLYPAKFAGKKPLFTKLTKFFQ